MNDKGQSLVLFVFLIPLFIAIFAYVFDTCYIKINNNKLDNLSALAMNYVLKDKNKIEIEQLILESMQQHMTHLREVLLEITYTCEPQEYDLNLLVMISYLMMILKYR